MDTNTYIRQVLKEHLLTYDNRALTERGNEQSGTT
jgi:hypothetical protein